MVVGSATFTSDLLARLGWANVFAEERYPHTTVEEIEARDPDVVLLPDEPYVFGEADRSAFTRPTELISGRLITWYGPSLVEAYALK
jgi:ABC-type hemin transport system substrate-binding protein